MLKSLIDRREDLIAGLVTAGLGAFILVEAVGYRLGTMRSMGPGYFPMLLAVLMCLLGAGLILLSKPEPQNDDSLPPPIADRRGVFLVTAAFLAFALMIERVGLVPSVTVAVFLSALANRNTKLGVAVILAFGTAAVCWFIFSFALGLQIKAFG
ncbi:tripartite tricarboxylate transporter TctB family protein [Sulfitobacter sp. 20_GPM-1509m]|uniref:tripartite tricarboxylate transporter TctB family protein n=1 Tax=Sulfitobacter sp. 20_GPM-1509m TaxID=1380367 RepID=UPI00056B1A84|nr:tripartite tricarboxylate transporter TctB family protein [Sulfitobacter sp. 20_GPM-1509m]|tara:strand:+ start:17469 stop:17930 length:462 start_codon:yes stop_codon:yes gene_type:complete